MGQDPEDTSRDLERFLGDLHKELLQVVNGTKRFPDNYTIFQKYSHLFDMFLIAELGDQRTRETGEEKRRICYLHRFLQSNYPLFSVCELTDEFLEARSGISIGSCTGQMAVPSSSYLMRGVKGREERASLWDQRCRALQDLNPVLEKRLIGIHRACKEMGYDALTDLSLSVRGIDSRWLASALNNILDRTEPLYIAMLEEFLEPLSISLDEAREHDILYLLNGEQFDHMFPMDETGNSLLSAIRGMGVDLEEIRSIKMGESMSQGAAFIPITVPGDIHLLSLPTGGYLDYISHFGEAGKALQSVSVSPDIPMEYRYLGDRAIPESFSLLFQRIISTRLWLESRGKNEEIHSFRRLFYLNRMYQLRRLASILQYEMRMDTCPLSDAEDLYRSIMEENMHFSHSPEAYLIDIHLPFRSIDRLRAFVFEAMLRNALLEKFGEQWSKDTGTMEMLREIWPWGGKFELDELANSIGYAELNMEPLVEELEDRIRLI